MPAALVSCSLAVSPQGHVHFETPPRSASVIESALHDRLASAFALSPGAGLLQLGGAELDATLPPTLAFWREFAREFLARLSAMAAAGEVPESMAVTPPPGFLQELAAGAPPMAGGEYLSPEALAESWTALTAAANHRARECGGLQPFLAELHPSWQLVGRVCFHLAENREDPDAPFAFLATHIAKVSPGGRVQHVRLGTAVERQSRVRDRDGLLALLAPVEKAAAASPFIRSLVDSGDLYQAVPWSPSEAYQFLKAVPALEAGGILVRVPDWWKPGNPPRVQVQVTIGGKEPSRVGLESLIDFSARLALDGEPLSEAEWKAARRQAEGLALIKGRWVEMDRERLDQVLDYWKAVERAADAGGITFGEGMRILAGMASDRGPAALGDEPDTRQWTGLRPGPWLANLLATLRDPDPSDDDVTPDFRKVLRPYQRSGLRWLRLVHGLGLGGCLADDMGLGKTVQMLAFWRRLQSTGGKGTHLLVVPTSLLANWQAELRRFAPGLRTLVAHPSAASGTLRTHRPLADVDIVMTTYGYLHRLPWLEQVTWETIVLDEAQAIKNPATRQSRAVKALKGASRFALTGTPIENRLGDLWSLFDFLNPGLLGSARAFDRFARGLRPAEGPGYAPLRRLVQPYILRRLKTDRRIIRDLPEKTEMRTFCGLTKLQAALYQMAVDDLTGQLERVKDIQRRGIILKFLTRFKQICNHPSQWTGDGGYDPRQSGKFARLEELAETIAARQEKVLVFTQYREVTEPLAEFLRGVFGRPGLVLHGGSSVRQRAGMVTAFQTEDGPPFFVLSLKAGGVGLNLTEASHVIHFDRWWNPAVENQATDRAFRIGQRRNVLVHKLVCRGTVEERIDALIESKLALSKDVLAVDGGAALTAMSDRDLVAFVGLDLASASQEQ